MLQALYPPRDVKDFRVVVARDARTDRKPANRTAQITVWNVMGLVFEEGGDGGDFKAGQTFLVRRAGTCWSRTRVSDLWLGVKLTYQPAGVLDGPSSKCRWNSVPCHRKANTLDSFSMTAWKSPPTQLYLAADLIRFVRFRPGTDIITVGVNKYYVDTHNDSGLSIRKAWF